MLNHMLPTVIKCPILLLLRTDKVYVFVKNKIGRIYFVCYLNIGDIQLII